ncbi:MAG: hydrogenase maturation nickel metallochaperone HypA [Armatimonadota bacterium]|nr:hydrogenase maturation nickel metallochaperone HypA [Armatimonadota bacterium]
MHEVSIAHTLLQQVSELATRHHMAAVERVGVAVGRYSGVVPDALAFAFEILRDGALRTASLDIQATEGDDLRLEWIEGE